MARGQIPAPTATTTTLESSPWASGPRPMWRGSIITRELLLMDPRGATVSSRDTEQSARDASHQLETTQWS